VGWRLGACAFGGCGAEGWVGAWQEVGDEKLKVLIIVVEVRSM